MLRFIIYSRRSKIRKTGVQHTHETAEWEVKQYLESLDRQGTKYEILEHVAEDISGYGYYTKRPLFTKIVERCKEDRSITLLSSKPDRIARDSWTGSELLKSINMIVANQPDADDLTLQVMFAVSEKEVKNMSDRWRSTYKAKKARCNANGEVCVWGGNSPKHKESFQANKANHKTTRNTQRSNELRKPVVDSIKKMINYSGDSLTLLQMAQKLSEEGFLTPRGKLYTEASLSRLIKNNGIEYRKKSVKI